MLKLWGLYEVVYIVFFKIIEVYWDYKIIIVFVFDGRERVKLFNILLFLNVFWF